MTDFQIKNYGDSYNDQTDYHTPDFSKISKFQPLNLTKYFTNTTYQNENQQEYTNTTTESLDVKEIKDVIVEIFSESFKENTEILASTNEDFTINHFKTFLQNICTQFNDLNQSKQKEQQNKKELNEQCKKISEPITSERTRICKLIKSEKN
ncbi:hypothetical protein QTN25_006920 [Entamoeba marina]